MSLSAYTFLKQNELEGFEKLRLIIVSIKLLKIFDLHFLALESSFVLSLRCVLNYSLTLIDCLPGVIVLTSRRGTLFKISP